MNNFRVSIFQCFGPAYAGWNSETLKHSNIFNQEIIAFSFTGSQVTIFLFSKARLIILTVTDSS